MSVDYYSRLEQQRGPQPSEQMLAAIARGLRLTLNERDHLFRLAGHTAPIRTSHDRHVSPGLLRIIDRLADTPAQVMNEFGETLVQTASARTLFGDETSHQGLKRSVVYRWFTDPGCRAVYPVEDHPMHARAFTADLRATYAKLGPRSHAGVIVEALLADSAEFGPIWAEHEVNSTHTMEKRLQHKEVGVMELQCQLLLDPDQGQVLLVLTATPGSESYDKLQLLAVIGTQRLTP